MWNWTHPEHRWHHLWWAFVGERYLESAERLWKQARAR